MSFLQVELAEPKVDPANDYLSHVGKSPNKVLEWIIRHKNPLQCNESKWFNFSFKGFGVASKVHHVQMREKRNQKWERVCVLQKLDILFGLNTQSHSTYHTTFGSFDTNYKFISPKMMQFSKTSQRKKEFLWKGKKRKYFGIFWNIYNLKIF